MTSPIENEGTIVRVVRFRLPRRQNGLIGQVRAFISYSFQVIGYIRRNKKQGEGYDLVFSTSSRLQTAFLGTLVSKILKTKSIVELRDLFSENIGEMMGMAGKILFKPMINIMEYYVLKNSSKIVVVSPAFKSHILKKRPKMIVEVIPNGIDEEFIGGQFNKKTPSQPKVVLYAGNIGDGQGLEKIIPRLAAEKLFTHRFLIFGDGGKRTELIEASRNLPNITIFPPQPRKGDFRAVQGRGYFIFAPQ